MARRFILSLLILVGMPSLALAASPTASYLNFSTGEPGSYNAINGSGFGPSQGTNQVVLIDSNGVPHQAPITSWTDGQIVFYIPLTLVPTITDSVDGVTYSDFAVDVETQAGAPLITSSGSTTPPTSLFSGTPLFELWTTNGQADVKPHGNFSGTTQFCLSCHEVHGANGTANSQSPYGLLGTSVTDSQVTVVPANVVEEVCMTCHQVGGVSATTANAGANPPETFPMNPGFGTETVASTAHFQVYKNATRQVHQMGILVPPDSQTNVTLGYLSLNSSLYQDPGYNSAAPTGLYCGSCHSPHGNYSANAWLGWDAAQFSSNYGYNASGDATTAGQIPIPSASNNLWAQYIGNGGTGTIPLTNALLLENPGHQNGINTGASQNPNVPGNTSLGGGTDPSPISMNFYPYLTLETAQRPGFFVNPTTDQQSLGATDDTLSNFCMACHNLNGGANAYIYDYDGGKYDHGSHPLQAFLSPNNAGLPGHYDDVGDSAFDNGIFGSDTPTKGAYGRILNGCTSCHGGAENLMGTSQVDGTTVSINGTNYAAPDFTNGYTMSFAGAPTNTDFPHTDANTNDNDRVLHYPPDGLCLSCHDHKAGQSSLP